MANGPENVQSVGADCPSVEDAAHPTARKAQAPRSPKLRATNDDAHPGPAARERPPGGTPPPHRPGESIPTSSAAVKPVPRPRAPGHVETDAVTAAPPNDVDNVHSSPPLNPPVAPAPPMAARTVAAWRGPAWLVTLLDFLERELAAAATVDERLRLLRGFTSAACKIVFIAILSVAVLVAVITCAVIVAGELTDQPSGVLATTVVAATSAGSAAFGLRWYFHRRRSRRLLDTSRN